MIEQQARLLAQKASCLLAVKGHIVGIQFAPDEQAFATMAAREIAAEVAYCVVVKAAVSGRSYKLPKHHSGCNGSTRALGFARPSERFFSGELYNSLGLYKDLATSKAVAGTVTYCRTVNYGVMAKPLERYEDELPDVVIMITDSRNAMRVVQGYTYRFGMQTHLTMSGNQAICAECTSYPFESSRLNVSLLCSGTRHLAKWQDTDIAIGLPFSQFAATVDGIEKTANAVELDGRKTEIQRCFSARGLTEPDFQLGYTYYTDLAKQRRQQRKHGGR